MQLAELQARVQLFEQGEVERNVALQAASKRLKEENDTLRQENESLHAHVVQLEAQLAAIKQQTENTVPELQLFTVDKWTSGSGTRVGKRAREDLGSCLRRNVKRPKRGDDMDTMEEEATQVHSTTPSSPCDETSSHGVLTPGALPDLAAMDVDLASPASPHKPSTQSNQQQPEFRSCGMCSSPNDCLCQQYDLQPFNSPPVSHSALDTQLAAKSALLDAAANASAQTMSFPSASSMVGNPPTLALAVPLPKRPQRTGTQNVFLVQASSSSTATSTSTTNVATVEEGAVTKRAGCSGDPANCSACADSAFGKAFCNALRNSVCTLNPCPTCSGPSHDTNNTAPPIDSQTKPRPTTIPTSINPSNLSCCGDPSKCGGSSCSTVKTPPLHEHGLPPDPMVIAEAARREKGQGLRPSPVPALQSHLHSHGQEHGHGRGEGAEDEEELPTEEAWRRIETHPRAHLALEDRSRLHQLAEIMLGGTRSLVPSRAGSVSAGGDGSWQAKIQVEYELASVSGGGEGDGDEEDKPRLVPEDELIRCQRQPRRITMLPKRNVSEGLNWLDHFDREFGRG